MNHLKRSPGVAQAWAAVVGLDWADQAHQVCLRGAEGQGPAEDHVVEQKPAALEAWCLGLLKRFEGGKILVCLEQSQGAVINALMGYDFFEFCVPNPKSVARFREVFRPSQAKDDVNDAWLLCELARKHGAELPRWRPASASVRLLARLTSRRRRAVEDRTALELQLQAELKLAYPLALALFRRELCLPVAWRFLLRWPSLAELKQARLETIRKHFYASNCRSEKRMCERLEQIREARPLTKDPAVVQSGRLAVLDLARRIEAVSRSVNTYEKEIAVQMSGHADGRIFSSLPGAGPALAPRLLAAFGEDRSRFSSAQAAQEYFGVAPVCKQSGKSHAIYFRRGCSKFLRQTFHEFAGCSVFQCDWARRFVEAKKSQGHGHQAAVRALAFKWVRIIYRMWQEGATYDAARYNKSLQEKQSPYGSATSHIKTKIVLDG